MGLALGSSIISNNHEYGYKENVNAELALAKAYTNSCKAFSNSCSNAETNALQSMNNAKSSEDNAKISELNALESMNSAKESAASVKVWKTNCIKEIPQDIKLELNNGTLTLKAGSKLYAPNGFESDGTTKKFDVVTIANDINYRFTFVPSSNFSVMLFINQSGTEFVYSRLELACFSGETQPSGNYINWYKSNENRMYSIGNNATIEGSGFSFPIAKITQGSDGVTKSIDQLFNGFGYIGSTVFALPGVKGLIPNSRNADGSLKNIEIETDRVLSYEQAGSFSNFDVLLAREEGLTGYYVNLDTQNNVLIGQAGEIYKDRFVIGKASSESGRITSFTPKTVFHALDYNDKSTISGWSMPGDKFIDLTPAHGQSYIAPANGYFSLQGYMTNATLGNTLGLYNQTKKMGMSIQTPESAISQRNTFVPVSKGDVITVYCYSATVTQFRFIYAEGE